MAFDVYQTITNKIVAMIEAGQGEYRMPWHGAKINAPRNPFSGTKYRGINVPLLWAAAEQLGYKSNIWATYKQWQAAGAQVRKGEKSEMVFFWKQLVSKEDEEMAKEGWISAQAPRFVARAYNVFNSEQVDGWDLVPAEPVSLLSEDERIAAADRFFEATGARVEHGHGYAAYVPSADFIKMPDFGRFISAEAYYAIRGHETVHWTKHEKRCNREFSKRFGDQAYAFEELIAELGAAFLCADLGISNEPRPDHAFYIQSWLQVLRNDKRAIFTAGAKAQAAVDYLAGLVKTNSEDRRAVA